MKHDEHNEYTYYLYIFGDKVNLINFFFLIILLLLLCIIDAYNTCQIIAVAYYKDMVY